MSLNTGISTSQSFSATVPVIVSIVTMAHELGHGHGSYVCCEFANLAIDHLQHDLPSELASNGDVCTPDGTPQGIYGNYIMYTYASNGNLPNNNVFSQCTRDYVGGLIVDKASACFTSNQLIGA